MVSRGQATVKLHFDLAHMLILHVIAEGIVGMLQNEQFGLL